jgi:hypothetical protein
MEETVGAAKKQVQPMLAELHASKAAKPAGTRTQNGAGASGARKGPAAATSSAASGASALHQVQKILARK